MFKLLFDTHKFNSIYCCFKEDIPFKNENN